MRNINRFLILLCCTMPALVALAASSGQTTPGIVSVNKVAGIIPIDPDLYRGGQTGNCECHRREARSGLDGAVCAWASRLGNGAGGCQGCNDAWAPGGYYYEGEVNGRGDLIGCCTDSCQTPHEPQQHLYTSESDCSHGRDENACRGTACNYQMVN